MGIIPLQKVTIVNKLANDSGYAHAQYVTSKQQIEASVKKVIQCPIRAVVMNFEHSFNLNMEQLSNDYTTICAVLFS